MTRSSSLNPGISYVPCYIYRPGVQSCYFNVLQISHSPALADPWPDLSPVPNQDQERQTEKYPETFEKRVKEELKFEDIKVQLDKHNYKQKFYNLICWEEMAHIKILREK